MFARRREIPDVWKMDMSQILDSSSSDDENDEEKESEEDEEDADEKKKKLLKEEVSLQQSKGERNSAVGHMITSVPVRSRRRSRTRRSEITSCSSSTSSWRTEVSVFVCFLPPNWTFIV